MPRPRGRSHTQTTGPESHLARTAPSQEAEPRAPSRLPRSELRWPGPRSASGILLSPAPCAASSPGEQRQDCTRCHLPAGVTHESSRHAVSPGVKIPEAWGQERESMSIVSVSRCCRLCDGRGPMQLTSPEACGQSLRRTVLGGVGRLDRRPGLVARPALLAKSTQRGSRLTPRACNRVCCARRPSAHCGLDSGSACAPGRHKPPPLGALSCERPHGTPVSYTAHLVSCRAGRLLPKPPRR